MKAGRELRQKDAEARKTESAQRSPEQQLKRLDEMLGAGQGAAKERARLRAKLAA